MKGTRVKEENKVIAEPRKAKHKINEMRQKESNGETPGETGDTP